MEDLSSIMNLKFGDLIYFKYYVKTRIKGIVSGNFNNFMYILYIFYNITLISLN